MKKHTQITVKTHQKPSKYVTILRHFRVVLNGRCHGKSDDLDVKGRVPACSCRAFHGPMEGPRFSLWVFTSTNRSMLANDPGK